MYQSLLHTKFRWIVSDFDINAIRSDYVLEVDLEYSERLHEHVDLPFCPMW